jgi:hypothetical protein
MTLSDLGLLGNVHVATRVRLEATLGCIARSTQSLPCEGWLPQQKLVGFAT